jgi:SAM-dependent methyltransferase
MSTVSRYDAVADFYVAEVGDGLTDEGTAALLGLVVGGVRGKRILDLACGQGRAPANWRDEGPGHRGRLSSALITSARTADRAAPLGIAYVVGDATHTNRLEPGPFDGVVCNFGLSDIDDLDALDTVAALLLPGGLLVFSILHPCSPGWGEDVAGSWPPGGGYFDEGWCARPPAPSRSGAGWLQPSDALDLPQRARQAWIACQPRVGVPSSAGLARCPTFRRSSAELPGGAVQQAGGAR